MGTSNKKTSPAAVPEWGWKEKLQRGECAAVALQIKHNEVTEHWGTASALGTGGPERIGTELGNLEAGMVRGPPSSGAMWSKSRPAALQAQAVQRELNLAELCAVLPEKNSI